MVYVLVWEKDLWIFLTVLMQIFSAFRKLSCQKVRLNGIKKIIIHIGIMLRKRLFRYCGFSKEKPLSVKYGIGIDEHDHEGRVITLEFENFYMVTVYTPNSQRELTRLEYRMKWEDDFRNFLNDLRKNKPVVVTGDMNVAHKEIDLKNPKTNRKNAGFTDEERQKMTELLDSGFIDTFRYFYPDVEQKYSWWSYMFKSREKNAGWRIDYFLASKELEDRLISAEIHDKVLGSDHCPIELVIDL